MPADDRPFDPTSVDAPDAEGFAASLKHRRQAAEGLERDILTKVPLLYGSPGSLEPGGDPGIALARLHREELVQRNGGGVTQVSGKRSDVALPFERAMTAVAILLFLFFVFAG
jgi:hypothetical protein